MPISAPKYSGHETFVCRYAWLPKVVREVAVRGNHSLFRDDHEAMVRLGVGKNMARSAKFWAEAAGIIETRQEGGHQVTEFGRLLLGHEGYDEFLQQPRTLWLLHWKIATGFGYPIFYWQKMLNKWHRAEFSVSEVIPFLRRELPPETKPHSDRTLSDGFRVFVNTYVPTRGKKGEIADDNLDSPFIELGLIRPIGARATHDGASREPVYSFNLENKPAITSALFAYCLEDYWTNCYPGEKTLPFRFANAVEFSPGQVFKLPEQHVRRRLEDLAECTGGAREFVESSSMPQVVKKTDIDLEQMLDAVYQIA